MKHKFLFSVFIIFFILVFVGLGTWQIIRLNWKNNLILEIENSLKNPPVELVQSNKENFLKIKTSGSIDFDKQTVHIEQSKRKADVYLPIDDDLFEMLQQQNQDFGFQKYVAPRPKAIKGEYRPYSLHKLPVFARKLMQQAGLSDELRLSDLRRTGTTEMVDAGVGIGQIMSVTGHSNPNSVKPYMKNTLISANFALTERKKHSTSITNADKESV